MRSTLDSLFSSRPLIIPIYIFSYLIINLLNIKFSSIFSCSASNCHLIDIRLWLCSHTRPCFFAGSYFLVLLFYYFHYVLCAFVADLYCVFVKYHEASVCWEKYLCKCSMNLFPMFAFVVDMMFLILLAFIVMCLCVYKCCPQSVIIKIKLYQTFLYFI